MARPFESIVALALSTSLASCRDEQVPGGSITFQNDILDKEHNAYRIDEVVTTGGLTGFARTLKPGERVTIPHKRITSLRVTRQYADHTKVYRVECPSGFDRRIVVKLIDVHTNRLEGGCYLARRGERRGGAIRWEDD